MHNFPREKYNLLKLIWQWKEGLKRHVTIKECVGLARLNYISQNSLSCMFLVKVGHSGDSWQIWKAKRSSNHCVAPTCCVGELLIHLGVKRQLGLQLLHVPLASWARCVCLAPWCDSRARRVYLAPWWRTLASADLTSPPRPEPIRMDSGFSLFSWGASLCLWVWACSWSSLTACSVDSELQNQVWCRQPYRAGLKPAPSFA